MFTGCHGHSQSFLLFPANESEPDDRDDDGDEDEREERRKDVKQNVVVGLVVGSADAESLPCNKVTFK